MTYYVSKNGQKVGPLTLEQVQAQYQQGQFAATDLAWKEGMPTWAPLSEVLGLPATPPLQQQATTPQPAYQQPVAAQPVYQQPAYQQPAPQVVVNQSVAGQGIGGGSKPGSFLFPAIISTFCCCLPIGIFAIIKATQVDSKWNAGDVAGAYAAASSAKTWTLVAMGLGLLMYVAYFFFQIFIVILSEM